jgi:hypothetical protein
MTTTTGFILCRTCRGTRIRRLTHAVETCATCGGEGCIELDNAPLAGWRAPPVVRPRPGRYVRESSSLLDGLIATVRRWWRRRDER